MHPFLESRVYPDSHLWEQELRLDLLPADKVWQAANHVDWCVRFAAAAHASLTERAATRLVDDPDHRVRYALAGNPQTPDYLLGRLVQDPNLSVRARLAENPARLRPEILEALARDRGCGIRSRLEQRRDLPESIRMILEQQSVENSLGGALQTATDGERPVRHLQEVRGRSHADGAASWPHKVQKQVAIIGTGSFGLALAMVALRAGHQVTFIARDPAAVARLQADHYLALCHFETLNSFSGSLYGFDLLITAVPAQAIRTTVQWISERLERHRGWSGTPAPVVLAVSKGIDAKSLKLPHEILQRELPEGTQVGVLSGPNFAQEVRQGRPSAAVVASSDPATRRAVRQMLHQKVFHVDESDDMVGVAIAGALKNVAAIAAGIFDGIDFGHSARATVITWAFAEVAHIGIRLGANPVTFLGMSGLGDLILTCTGALSRNRQFGLRLARGESRDQIIADMGHVIEGVYTVECAVRLAKELGIQTPVIDFCYDVVYEKLSLQDALRKLFDRRSAEGSLIDEGYEQEMLPSYAKLAL